MMGLGSPVLCGSLGSEWQWLNSESRSFLNVALSLALLSLLVCENNRQKLGQSPALTLCFPATQRLHSSHSGKTLLHFSRYLNLIFFSFNTLLLWPDWKVLESELLYSGDI